MNEKDPDIYLLLASLCDAIKRLEWAMLAGTTVDQRAYIHEAKKRRAYVEEKILKAPISKI